MVNKLFDDFKKNLLKKGIDLEQKISIDESSKILENILDTRERGPFAHSDHSSFTRHSSCAADDEPSSTCTDGENNPSSNSSNCP